jgi:hypothetical protein
MNGIQKYVTHLKFLMYLLTISYSVVKLLPTVFLDITLVGGEEGNPGICPTLAFWEKK